jgi:hypothetical protein
MWLTRHQHRYCSLHIYLILLIPHQNHSIYERLNQLKSSIATVRFRFRMFIAQKLEANEAQPASSDSSDELELPMNPFAPTRAQFILLMIGLFFALDRRSIIRILPFHLGLLGGIIPPECLMWSLVLADMAKRDIIHMWDDIEAPSSSRNRMEQAERKW